MAGIDQVIVEYDIRIAKAEADIRKLTTGFKAVETAAQGSAKKTNQAFNETSGIINNLRKKTEDLRKARDSADNVASIKKYNAELKTTEAQLNKLTGVHSNLITQIKGIGTAIGIAFSAQIITNFIRSTIQAGAAFEQTRVAFANALGSDEAADNLLSRIDEFAKKTPFQIQEIENSFLKLINRGFIPTEQELTKLGDLAASQGKGLDQFVEAILDAQTGEFERLKEFGIKARVAGDQIKLSFRGQTVEVKNTSDAIKSAIIDFGALEGVQGSMAKQAETTAGQYSNFNDNLSLLQRNISSSILPALNDLLHATNETFFGLESSQTQKNNLFEENLFRITDAIDKGDKTLESFKAQLNSTIIPFNPLNDKVFLAKSRFNEWISSTEGQANALQILGSGLTTDSKVLQEFLRLQGLSNEQIQGLIDKTTTFDAILNKNVETKNKDVTATHKQLTAYEALNKRISDLTLQLNNQALKGEINVQTLRKLKKATDDLAGAQKEVADALAGTESITGLDIQTDDAAEQGVKDVQAIIDKIDSEVELPEPIPIRFVADTDSLISIQEKAKIASDSIQAFGEISTAAFALFGQGLREGSDEAKAFALFQVAVNTAIAIGNAIAGATAAGAATGPAAPVTTPLFIAEIVAIVLGAIGQASAILSSPAANPSFFSGTDYLQLNGNKPGRDTIPVWANMGEAIIPTSKNAEYPGMSKAWIDGKLDDYIYKNWVTPVLKEQEKKMQQDFASNIANSMVLNQKFDDYRLWKAASQNVAATKSGLSAVVDAIKKQNPKRGGYAS